MKKIFALTLVLVLAIGASAMAATTLTTTGKVYWGSDNVLADNIVWNGASYRLLFSGTTSETTGFAVRFDNANASDGAAGTVVVPSMSRANYWVKSPVGKVVVGKQADSYSPLGINFATDMSYASFTGVSLYPTIAEGVSAFGFWNPGAKQFGAQAKATVAAATVFGAISKKDADDDMKLSVGASYPVIADKLTVYGQFDKQGDADEKFLGASTSFAGIDVVGEYKLEDEEFALDFTKTIGGVEFNATYTNDQQDPDGTLSFTTALYF